MKAQDGKISCTIGLALVILFACPAAASLTVSPVEAVASSIGFSDEATVVGQLSFFGASHTAADSPMLPPTFRLTAGNMVVQMDRNEPTVQAQVFVRASQLYNRTDFPFEAAQAIGTSNMEGYRIIIVPNEGKQVALSQSARCGGRAQRL